MAVLLAMAAVSCSGIGEGVISEDQADNPVLVLSVDAADIARESRTPAPDAEKMHSLRIVMLDAGGNVEHNFHIGFDYGSELYNHHVAVTPGHKKIFLIANEESVTDAATGQPLADLLDGFATGSAGFEEMVNGVVFVPDPTLPVVMTATYDIELAKGRNECELHLVKSVAKFTFNFENIRPDDVSIRKIVISSTADRAYLMAHVGDTDLFKTTPDGNRVWWIDWLRDVAEQTEDQPRNPANSQLNGLLGWIRDYSIPDDCVTRQLVIDFSRENSLTVPACTTASTGSAIPGYKAGVGPYYTPESRCMPAGASPLSDQTYTVSFDIDGAGGILTRQLPEVKALFRNTHVIVDVLLSKNLKDLQIICTVDIQPYSSVELRPDFGLERDNTGALLNRDSFGYLTDDKGNHVDAYGNPAVLEYDSDGKPTRFTDFEGYMLNKDGYPIDSDGEAGYRDETDHRVRNHMGYIMDRNGNLTDCNGDPAYHDPDETEYYIVRDKYGYIINYEGYLVDRHGNPAWRDTDGTVRRESDNKIVDKNGNVID